MITARAKTARHKRTGKGQSKPQQSRKTTKPAREPKVALEPKESNLVLARFRLLARCRGAWLQYLWMSDGPNAGPIDGRATVTHEELAGILADRDSPNAEAEWAQSQAPIRAWKREAEEIHRSLTRMQGSRFAQLIRVFGLDRSEIDLLQLCAAVAFDPALGRVCAYLQDHSERTYLTEDLAARLLSTGRTSAWTPEMKVFRWELIHRREAGIGEPHALTCDPQIRDWLLGKSTLDELLIGCARLLESSVAGLPEWPVDEIAAWISESLSNTVAPRLRVVVVAPSGGGKRSFVAAVMQKLNMRVLAVNVDNKEESNWSRLFLHAQRQVFLDAAALAWTGDAAVRRQWPANQALFPIQFVLCEPGSEPAAIPGAVDRHVRLPMPGTATREWLWRHSSPAAAKWSKNEIQRLAEHHSVWPGDIQRAGHLDADTPANAASVVREAARFRFGNLAQILECPFKPDDLVLPAGVKQVLDAIIFEAEERVRFWQQQEPLRLFPQGRGLIALFSGPSGTGKTMAAQVIAAQLTQDLCRVNVAQLVSKWVGETSKNCEQVIRVAAENNAVLFFDEADGLFARRTSDIRDAQDKFSNTDSSFLLQAIESYPGIAILATNLKSNIDHAFMRRLRYLVEFPKPDTTLQLTLWTKLVTALAGEERARALEPALKLLSIGNDATGAQIKFAILGALFAARADANPLSARHLLMGLDRELGKDGRTIGPRERDRILKLGEAA